MPGPIDQLDAKRPLVLSAESFPRDYLVNEAGKSIERLKTVAGILIRELERKLSLEVLKRQKENFDLYRQVVAQKRNSKNEIYSLHEPRVYRVAKGRDRKPYEYGTKVSVATTRKSGIVVGVVNRETNIRDGKTLEEAVGHIETALGKTPKTIVCDRGYRSASKIDGSTVASPKAPVKRDTACRRRKKRRLCRRRSAIEPIVGHLKSDFRLSRNYLGGQLGDQIDLPMAASAWNLEKWMAAAALFYFFIIYRLVFTNRERVKLTF